MRSVRVRFRLRMLPWIATAILGAIACAFTPPLVAQDRDWELREELRIGSLDEENYVFQAPFHLVTDEEGNVYVSEPALAEVLVYTSEGRFVRRLGGRGEGPGEFRSISGLLWANGRLWVLDRGARRVTAFGADGEVLETRQIQIAGDRGLRLEGVLADGSVLATEAVIPPRLGEDFVAERELLRLRGGDTSPESLGVMVRRAPISSRVTVETPQGVGLFNVTTGGLHDRFAIGGDGSRIYLLSPSYDASGVLGEALLRAYDLEGRPLFSRRIPIEPVPVSSAERDEAHGALVAALVQAGLTSRAAASLVRETPPLGEYRFAMSALVAGRQGEIWIAPGRTPYLVAFDGTSGAELSRVRLPDGMGAILAVDGRQVWALEKADLGIPVLVRYRLDSPDAS